VSRSCPHTAPPYQTRSPVPHASTNTSNWAAADVTQQPAVAALTIYTTACIVHFCSSLLFNPYDPPCFPLHSWNAVPLLYRELATTLRGSRVRGCNPHRSLWRHWWRHNSETITDREKRRPPRPMKSSELSNGENRIALRQLLQNRKWRHLCRHNLGSRRKLEKMARDNFSIGTFYNITKNQHSPIKTVGRDSFLSSETPKTQVFRGHPAPKGRTAPIF